MVIKRSSAVEGKNKPSKRAVKHPELSPAAKVVVGKGDSLGVLAKKHGVSVKELKAANPGLATAKRHGGNLLLLGDEVVLPSRKGDLARADLKSAAVPAPAAEGAIGRAFAHSGNPSPFKKINAEFDGRDFIVYGDGKEVLRVAAHSGRGFTVDDAEAKKFGGAPGDSYLNNGKYTAVHEDGPLPEGTYEFRAEQMMLFSTRESLGLFFESGKLDGGRGIHHGDWGTGRVEIVPTKRTRTLGRSGFFLHGGLMPGSSGCVDIGNDAIGKLAGLLDGYRGKVAITTRYTQPPPKVTWLQKAATGLTYPPQEQPSMIDRARSMFEAVTDKRRSPVELSGKAPKPKGRFS
jgi:LysM repeat protein